jgi:hypothetical protein
MPESTGNNDRAFGLDLAEVSAILDQTLLSAPDCSLTPSI